MKQLPRWSKSENAAQPLEGNGASLPRDRPFPFKVIVYMAGGIVAAFLLALMFRPNPIAVDTGTVTRGDLQVTINAEGKTRIRDRYVLAAPVNGQLDRILLSEGDPIQQGTLVARIDPLPLNTSVQEALGRLAEWRAQREGVATQRPKTEAIAQARARVLAAEANYRQVEAQVAAAAATWNQARRDRQRADQLANSGAIARQAQESAILTETSRAKELDAAQMTAQAAAAEVTAAKDALALIQKEQADPDYLLKVYDARIASTEAELTRLQDHAARSEIRSPVSGQVLRIQQKSAQFVGEGTPLLEIGDPSQLELVIDVLSSDAEKIQPGDRILVQSATTSTPLSAKVRRVEPAAFTKVSALGVEEQRVNVIGDFVEPPRWLGDAYRVDSRIVIWSGQNVVQVPLSALFRCAKTDWCVFSFQAGKAHRQTVKIGQRNDQAAEVQQGLQPGETVILYPTDQLKDGSQVKPRSSL